jgi:hypothetical protein
MSFANALINNPTNATNHIIGENGAVICENAEHLGVQVSASHLSVQMLQGYSPGILKFALFGEYDDTNLTVTADDRTKTTVKE